MNDKKSERVYVETNSDQCVSYPKSSEFMLPRVWKLPSPFKQSVAIFTLRNKFFTKVIKVYSKSV